MTPRHGVWSRWTVVAAVLLAVACGSQRLLPELPQPSMEDFVPDVRARMQAALDDARANPEQAAANGELGMLLQAYDLDEAAAACYERAAILDGEEFRWQYYRAAALDTLGRDADAGPHDLRQIVFS